MKTIKRIVAVMLSMFVLLIGMPCVYGMEGMGGNVSPLMYSSGIALFGDVRNGVVLTEVEVDAPLPTTSISLLCILREENDAGNYIIVDTWTDSAEGDYLLGEYSYSPASDTRKYELSVRVGIYDENGLVGYDYETLTNID